MLKYCILYISALLLLFSCKKEEKALPVGYYYWKNRTLDMPEAERLDSAGVQFIYAKIADVVWNGRSGEPQPATRLPGLLPPGYTNASLEIVPVIFITNDVMLKMDSAGCAALAGNVCRYYRDWIARFADRSVRELQVDCDWTPQSRDRYFYFLQQLKGQLRDKSLSVTLRLYPYKYPSVMGVPPVDKAVLMCYNMGNIKDYGETNSILTVRTLQSYLVKKPYPLPLDPALPVYGWYVWYSGKQYKGIIYQNEYEQLLPYMQPKDSVYSMLTKDVTTAFKYFRMGDELRAEFPDPRELQASLALLRQYFPRAQRLLLFHWDEQHVKRYAPLLRQWSAGTYGN